MDTTDEVMVQALEPYMEGREFKNAQSQPYPLPRHAAMELVGNNFAKIVDAVPPKRVDPSKPVEPPVEDDEPDDEQPDDASDSAAAVTKPPVAAAHGGPLSTVPAKPGDEPVTPTQPAVPRRGRGRPPAARKV